MYQPCTQTAMVQKILITMSFQEGFGLKTIPQQGVSVLDFYDDRL